MTPVDEALEAQATADGWGRVAGRAKSMAKWATVATRLAADEMAKPKPSRRELRQGRRIAERANELVAAKEVARELAMARQRDGHVATATQDGPAATAPRESWVRNIAPIAALGTAAVMQVVVFTDTFGGRLAAAMATHPGSWAAGHTWIGYLAGLLLGIAVAACAEGGAAHLMSLYERHLLARDATGLLRIGMLAYVGGSAWLIHWWLDQHQYPAEIAYALAAMTGSAIFLRTRASWWRNRVAMRAAGQLDQAMPKMPLAAKIMHPLRWIQTQYAISWDPVATTAEARERYAELVATRRVAKQEQDAATLDEVAKQMATRMLAEHLASLEGNAEESADPWGEAVPAEAVDPDRDLAEWMATPDGQAYVATAKQSVAKRSSAATYDVAAVKAAIRRGLDEITEDMSREDVNALKRRIDAATMAAAGISQRRARALRGEVSGEPISGPPANEMEKQ